MRYLYWWALGTVRSVPYDAVCKTLLYCDNNVTVPAIDENPLLSWRFSGINLSFEMSSQCLTLYHYITNMEIWILLQSVSVNLNI